MIFKEGDKFKLGGELLGLGYDQYTYFILSIDEDEVKVSWVEENEDNDYTTYDAESVNQFIEEGDWVLIKEEN